MPARAKKQPSDTPKVPKAQKAQRLKKSARVTPVAEDLLLVAAPDKDAIASRAFELYLRDGGVDGRDLEHWLRAEREVVGASHELER